MSSRGTRAIPREDAREAHSAPAPRLLERKTRCVRQSLAPAAILPPANGTLPPPPTASLAHPERAIARTRRAQPSSRVASRFRNSGAPACLTSKANSPLGPWVEAPRSPKRANLRLELGPLQALPFEGFGFERRCSPRMTGTCREHDSYERLRRVQQREASARLMRGMNQKPAESTTATVRPGSGLVCVAAGSVVSQPAAPGDRGEAAITLAPLQKTIQEILDPVALHTRPVKEWRGLYKSFFGFFAPNGAADKRKGGLGRLRRRCSTPT